MRPGVGMPPIDEPFAPVAEGELAAGNGGAFEIHRRHQPEVPPCTRVEQQRRLDNANFTEGTPGGHDGG